MGWFDQALSPEQLASIQRGPDGRPLQTGTVRSLDVPSVQPSAQDPRAYFESLFPGNTLTPQALAAQEQALAAQGIRLLGPNAAGMRTKIELPGGQIVDVIGGAGAGHNRRQWMMDSGPSGGRAPLASLGGGMMGGGEPQGNRMDALKVSPGFEFVLNRGIDALDKSASAKGTLLNGGYKKDLMDFAMGAASQEYGNEFNRRYTLADMGLRAAGAQGAYGTQYGNQITDLTTGAGNAQAAGTAASGNAWGDSLGNLGNLGMQAGLYQWLKPKPATV